jgi:hypothetical protein
MVAVSGIIKETEMHIKASSYSSSPSPPHPHPPFPAFALGNSAIMHRVYAAAADDDNMGSCV